MWYLSCKIKQELNCIFSFIPHFWICLHFETAPLGALNVCELNDLHTHSFNRCDWRLCVQEACTTVGGTASAATQAWVQIPAPPLTSCVTFLKWLNNNIYFPPPPLLGYQVSNTLLWLFPFYRLGHRTLSQRGQVICSNSLPMVEPRLNPQVCVTPKTSCPYLLSLSLLHYSASLSFSFLG